MDWGDPYRPISSPLEMMDLRVLKAVTLEATA